MDPKDGTGKDFDELKKKILKIGLTSVTSIITNITEAATEGASTSQLVRSPTGNLDKESVEKVIKIELLGSAESFAGTEIVKKEENKVESQESIKDNLDG